MSAALGDPVMSMRIRDGLASLAYLRSRPEVDSENIVVTGTGLGGIVAMHVAAIDSAVQGVVIWNSLFSFRTLLETENYTWPADAFIPQVLLYYDLPDLAASLTMPVTILHPLDGVAQPVSDHILAEFNRKSDSQMYLADFSTGAIISHIQHIFTSE